MYLRPLFSLVVVQLTDAVQRVLYCVDIDMDLASMDYDRFPLVRCSKFMVEL